MQKSSLFKKVPLLSKFICLLPFSFVKTMNSICRKSTSYSVPRYVVPDDRVSWLVLWLEYSPPKFTADHLKDCSWADPDVWNLYFDPKWNAVDGNIDRRSFDNNKLIKYDIDEKYPLNPRGRTGLCGRGRLGRWGPNHAADAVVTRWKTSSNMAKVLNPQTNQPILQFLAILRKDCRKWAIPGGFVNVSEKPLNATIRELFEEAINPDKLSENSKALLEKLFSEGKQVYKGYVDDPRNTDNAWIETTASNFHDDSGEYTNDLVLEARDDAADVKWVDITEDMDIYETHNDIIRHVNQLHLQTIKEKS